MARKLESWKCDICNREYYSKLEAERCEAQHGVVVETELKYEHDLGGGCSYPEAVVLTFGDGTIKTYYPE